MVDATQTILTVSVPSLVVLLGILLNNSRLSDLRALVDSNQANTRASAADLRDLMNARFDAVDARFDELRAGMLRVEQVMDVRLKHLEENR